MKLLINFISKLGVDSVSRLIGFLTLPVITRALGPEGYGLFSYLFIILSYFGFFIDFGYLNYGTNKLCDKIDSKTVIGKIISLQILTLIFSFLILIVVAYFFLDLSKYFMLLMFSLTYFSQLLAIRYYYLANNKLYFNSMAELAGQIIYALLIFLVFTYSPSVMNLIIFSVIQSLVTSLFLFLPYIRKNKIHINLNIKANLKTLKEAYKLGLSSKAEGISASFVILCIGFFLNAQSVGVYNASYKIYLILLTVIQGASYTMMPMLLSYVKNKDRNNARRISLIFYTFIILGIILSAVTYFFSEIIIMVMFGEQFTASIEILKIFSLTILIIPVWMFLALMLLAYNKYNYVLLVSISSMVFSIILSIFLVNVFGVIGAAFVLPLVSFGTIAVCLYSLGKISKSENFRLIELFSLRSAFEELSLLLKRS